MNASSVCYLDNAATSFPKPESVYNEVRRCLLSYCGNPGRSAHSLSLAAANKIYDCRVAAAELIGIDAPENIAFVPSSTFGLNMIIKGLLKYGDHVIISNMEHNAVYRPIYKLAREGKISYDTFSVLDKEKKLSNDEICRNLETLIRKNTRLVICNHQSNVCSCALPACEIGRVCKKHGIIFALDAAQSAGHCDINMQRDSIDILCAPGHKGLYGLQGSAFVAFGSSQIKLDTLIEGGNGIRSLDGDMPDLCPERYESGTLATPCIAGLCEGIREIRRIGIPEIVGRESELYSRLLEDLGAIRGINIYGSSHVGSTLLFNAAGYSSESLAARLNDRGICVRGGFHCSALAHASLGTETEGGVRVSLGIFNTKKDIDRLTVAVNDILKNKQ